MPNRIIKESICTSENIDRLSAFNETFFYRLIVNCDDYGRMDARPKLLASKLYPLKDVRLSQIKDALRELTSAELVTLYEVDGKPFLQMNTWERHQVVRAHKSKYPSPDEAMNNSASKCKQMKANESKSFRNPIQSNPNPQQSECAFAQVDDDGWKRVADAYHREIGGLPTGTALEMFASYVTDLGADAVIVAIKQTNADQPSHPWKWLKAILDDFADHGVNSEATAIARCNEHERRKAAKKKDCPEQQSEKPINWSF